MLRPGAIFKLAGMNLLLRVLTCLVLICGLFLHGVLQAETKPPTLLVAAASDLQFVFPELIGLYEAGQPGVKVGVTYGASGKFFEQLKNGAPFDLFLSADAFFPRKLIEMGKGDEGDFFMYAVGHLVVWVQKTSALDVRAQGMQVLLDPSVKKIAIANPDHAPYGRAAVAAMQNVGVYDASKVRLVLGENVVQAAQFVETGAADVGIIGLSLALAPKMLEKGRYWEIPQNLFPKLEQGGLVLRDAKNAAEARKFRAWLQTLAAKEILRKYGFVLPPS